MRNTVDLGIDLGTTNSCAAIFGENGPEVVRAGDRDYIPSVVLIRDGAMHVGVKAYNALSDPKRWDDVHQEFKRLMGLQEPFVFRSSGESRTAEELSAEVLKELSGFVECKCPGERLHAAAITVPAWFESVQREATLRAGNAAGFDDVCLLQEPIAAALGYGFGLGTATSEKWLVFDLGGGTLDVAIVESADGELRVIDHAGDNYRGGKDLDWMLLENIVQPRLAEKHRIPAFDKNAGFWKRLKPRAEEAKIELSSKSKAGVDPDGDIESLDGEPISTVVEINRDEYQHLISPWIDEAIDFCPDLLRRCSVAGSKISRVLLVGGPTHTPLLRRRIVERLGIPIEVRSIDPMTVVARGAAVFAGSRQSKLASSFAVGPTGTTLELHYKPVYADLDPMVAGKFAESTTAVSVEITRNDGGWSSGKLNLVDSGFMTRVLLESGRRSVFTVRAYDNRGTGVDVTPSSFSITHGLESAPPTLPMSFKLPVEESGSRGARIVSDTLIAKGTPLPCSSAKDYRTRLAVRAGSEDDVIRIPLVEGEFETLDFNRHVGSVVITGKQLKRNLPENTEIAVTLRVDENGIPEISAYIPYLDENFRLVLRDKFMPEVDPDALNTQVTEEIDRARALVRELESTADSPDTVHLRAETDQVLSRLEDLADNLAAAGATTGDDRQKADRERKNASDGLERVITARELPRAVSEFENAVEWATDVIETHGNVEEKELLAALVAEGREAGAQGNLSRLQAKKSDLLSRTWQVLFRIPDFWIGTFQDMNTNRYKFTDPTDADVLLAQGRAALARQDLVTLKGVVWQLWELYPDVSKQETSRRFLETGLRMK